MQVAVFGLISPVIPLLIWLRRQKEDRVSTRELIFRYAIYTLAMTLLVALVMVFTADEGISFRSKADASPVFLLKYALLELAAAGVVAWAEWLCAIHRPVIRIATDEYRDMGIVRFVQKILFPCGIYLTAAAVILLNVSLMFDNVLWGDECFSANTAQKSMSGILQVMYFWDNHPPLHYYWLKLFGELFGHTGVVYHLASLTPFLIGIALALICLRRRFGNIPAAFFIIITGLAAPCVEYNLEIRMYSLAFMGVACCYYCAYRALSGGKLAWFGMVFWALVGAYSHYYAMMTVGIMIFITGVAAAVRYRGKTWLKGVAALIAFILGYTPWLGYLFHATDNVSNNWWVSEILGLKDSVRMLLFGAGYEKILLGLLAVLLILLFVTDSSVLRMKKKETGTEIMIHRPTLASWGDETYGAAVGILTIVGTLIAAYVLCLIVGPVLVDRYLYPVSAVTALLLVICGSGCLSLIREWGRKLRKSYLTGLAKCVLLATLALLCVIGWGNYGTYRSQVNAEKAVTEQALYLIGDVPEDTALISNNVKHLAWTVLYYYYPDRKIIAGNCIDEGAAYDKFWYFTTDYMNSEELLEMYDRGYTIANYDWQQIAVYPFVLYYFERDAQ
ncbi:MAG: glycosyltransferase family 39 protein [Acetatifactor muris]|nr:glycosyltransferase family 39 protein [Acetatifactor muris]MCM1528007.1 glycosyltransferase family 39 protein [Bacteroides sp.]